MQTLAGAGQRGARRPEEAAESTGKTIFKEEPGKRPQCPVNEWNATTVLPCTDGMRCRGEEGPPDHLG